MVGKSEGKTPLGSPRRRWEDNNKMDLKEMGLKGVEWIHLAQDTSPWPNVANTIMNFPFL
jgi:hypothetical protein